MLDQRGDFMNGAFGAPNFNGTSNVFSIPAGLGCLEIQTLGDNQPVTVTLQQLLPDPAGGDQSVPQVVVTAIADSTRLNPPSWFQTTGGLFNVTTTSPVAQVSVWHSQGQV